MRLPIWCFSWNYIAKTPLSRGRTVSRSLVRRCLWCCTIISRLLLLSGNQLNIENWGISILDIYGVKSSPLGQLHYKLAPEMLCLEIILKLPFGNLGALTPNSNMGGIWFVWMKYQSQWLAGYLVLACQSSLPSTLGILGLSRTQLNWLAKIF